ncbi:MAG: LysR family transcriptional regulator [Gammaproteobacteria bacterium]|nr:LysR family transcriptional regulator [Gammaproteobacteria bacterium]
MDKLIAMRTFVSIVDQGSLTAAAESLDRSLPTVVRTLGALENHLGTRLLRRTTRRMSLTPEGQNYLARCRRILLDVEDAELSVTRGQVEPRGRIRMTAPVLFGQRHVAPAVTTFLGRYADVEVELMLLDRVVNLVDEGFDLGLRIAELADSSMIATPVGRVRRVVCAGPSLIKSVGRPTHPKALADLPCVRFGGSDSADTWQFKDGPKDTTVRIKGRLACNSAQAAAEACARDLGFGMFLSYQVEPLVRAKRLEVVLREFERPAIPVSLVYPDARLVSTRVRALLDWLGQTLKDRPEIH